MPPDVTLISPYPPPGMTHAGHSGVASYTANLARALVDQGADVAVLAPGEDLSPGTDFDGQIAVHRVGARGVAVLPALARAASRLGAPVVHLQHETYLFGGPAGLAGLPSALRTIRRSRGRSVVTVHQVVSPSRITREFTRLHRVRLPPVLARNAMSWLQNTLRRSFDGVVVHQEAFADDLPGAVVIPHGVEEVARIDRKEARRLLGLANEERLVVLCFGFIAPYKGLELALEAASQVPEIRLVIAGGAHPRHGTGYVEHLSKTWGDHARFTGRVPDDQVALWHSASDLALFCYPAPHAASGALALALAHDTPFLATTELARYIGAPADVAVSRDPAVLASRLRTLAADRSRLAKLKMVSSQMAAAGTWPKVARRHLELYEGL